MEEMKAQASLITRYVTFWAFPNISDSLRDVSSALHLFISPLPSFSSINMMEQYSSVPPGPPNKESNELLSLISALLKN